MTRPAQVLVELILAIAVVGALAGISTTAFAEIGANITLNNYRLQAVHLAEEGTEALRHLRDNNWENLVNASYPAYPQINGGNWQLTTGSETIDIFTRQITVTDVNRDSSGNINPSGSADQNSKKFTVTVSWNWRGLSRSEIKEIILTRRLNNQNWQETTLTDFNDGGYNNTAGQTGSSDGEVVLASAGGGGGPPIDWGNRLSATATAATTLFDDPNKTLDFRFSVENNISIVNRIYVYVQENTAQHSSYFIYGLQSDNNGKPSGNWLNSSAYGNIYGDQIIVGWNALSLNSGAALTAGQVYHLIFARQTGPSNSNRYISFKAMTPLSQTAVYSGNDDLNRAILACANCSHSQMGNWPSQTWSDQNQTPIFLLDGSATGNPIFAEGNPYYQISDINICFGSMTVKQEKFVYYGPAQSIVKIGVIAKRATPGREPEADLVLTIANLADTQVLATASIAKNQVGDNYAYYEADASGAATLQVGQTYLLKFTSLAGVPMNGYYIPALDTVTGTTNDAQYQGRTFRGAEAIARIVGIGIPGPVTDMPYRDFPFWLKASSAGGGSTYQSSGDYISSILSLAAPAGGNRLDLEIDQPDNTDLRLQFDSSPDGLSWTGFVGPDGTITSYFSATGGVVPLNRNRGQYFRYKAFLTTNNPSVTPALEKLILNYSD
ncbi:MAG: Uncharacterized protein CEN88_399, partial [Candidatus Berkelbacteria bacterium Licking1014_2]